VQSLTYLQGGRQLDQRVTRILMRIEKLTVLMVEQGSIWLRKPEVDPRAGAAAAEGFRGVYRRGDKARVGRPQGGGSIRRQGSDSRSQK
jgi:hypothetical protein